MDIKTLEKKIKNNGYKLTNQRKGIIKTLFEHKNHFLSAEEIFSKLKEKNIKTNLSTVYRNLEILEKIDIIHKINIDGNYFKYELIQNKKQHNHVIICKNCGKTEKINFCPLEKIISNITNNNFVLTDHKFELYGYCNKCKIK
ncbi:Fur family transcriptional regulator [Tepidibacter thalassicus]|uniref:Fur family transcriptional regulator, ferric uptake regulator n=1 Tax=Tepidibacter thalassicus DSM 15285 TaxID=1123350 RepID=A0A1M5NPX6_9FIRM|nr:transcriptional repressor [Tepidibacter thalassicus]SHG91606.1 Fur family transcriptional regulator, ferric uptake regulator [Tepidibacter thalassicus DSM 15285]